MSPWQPMERMHAVIDPDIALLAKTDPRVREVLDQSREVWGNDLYTVIVYRDSRNRVSHLSIRRDDREAARDWRHFQQIKNDIAGPDCEAVELYPAEDRLVDMANQYHLWVFPPGFRIPFGFQERAVQEEVPAGFGKARQRSRVAS